MKVILTAILLAATAYGQSNTFPNTGYAGVGTTSPVAPLDIVGNQGTGWLQTAVRVANGVPDTGIHIVNTTPGGHDYALFSSGTGSGLAAGTFTIGDATLGVARLSLLSNGNMGLGTTNPNYLLHVNGQAKANSLVVSNPSYAGQLVLGSSANYEPGLGSDTNLILTAGGGANLIHRINSTEVMRITAAGNVGIGTSTPAQKLSVNGAVRAKEVIVDTGWADYVFDESYKLSALSEVERRIKAEKHLPGIPSAKEVAEKGISLGDMQAKLLAKVEELTLYMINLEKKNAALQAEVNELKRANALR